MPDMDQNFITQMRRLDIGDAHAQQVLWSIAQQCIAQVGVPTPSKIVAGHAAPDVILPDVGTVSGQVALMLAGLAGRTLSVVTLTLPQRERIKDLARGR